MQIIALAYHDFTTRIVEAPYLAVLPLVVLSLSFLLTKSRQAHGIEQQIERLTNLTAYRNKALHTYQGYKKAVLAVMVMAVLLAVGFVGACCLGYLYEEYRWIKRRALSKRSVLVCMAVMGVMWLVKALLQRCERKSGEEYLQVKSQESKMMGSFINELPPDLVDSLRFIMREMRARQYCQKLCGHKLKELYLQLGTTKTLIVKLTEFEWCPKCAGETQAAGAKAQGEDLQSKIAYLQEFKDSSCVCGRQFVEWFRQNIR